MMENLDKDLCEFFFGLTKEHLTYFTNPETVKLVEKVVPEIRRKSKGKRPKKGSHYRKFHSPGNLAVASRLQDAAHSFELNVCLASSTVKVFSELMADNAEFFSGKMHRKSVGLCCIGGMASEMVTVVETLCRKARGDCHTQEFLHFQLAFIDADDRWGCIVGSVMRQLGEDAKAKYRIKLTPRFVQSQKRDEVVEVLRSSDVVISTKFSAQLSDLRIKLFQQLLKEALQHMKSDSLFLIIDSSTAAIAKCLERDISKFGRFQMVYSKTYGNHCLSLDCAGHNLKLYSHYFGVDLSRSYCFFSARAWLKSKNLKDSLKDRVQTSLRADRDRRVEKNRKYSPLT